MHLMNEIKVNEIFHSLQGEGYNAGISAVFLRLSGCNLNCPFCDTDHEEGEMMSEEQIVARIESIRRGAQLVVITGGEPSLWLKSSLLDAIHALDPDIRISIETNGTRPLPEGIDFVTLSPKDQFCSGAQLVLESCDELKLLYPGADPSRYSHIRAKHRFLQPCATNDMPTNRENMARTVEYVKEHPQWRLSLQIHKILDIR